MGGGVYRLKIEGAFVRFRQAGDHWEADAPDGTTYRFGVSAGARGGATAGTFRWALEQMIDVSGNRIVFSYEADRGQIYLTRIDYNVRAGSARNAVEVGYEARADVVTDFRAGFGVTTARRLARVKMTSGGAQVRRYQLQYAPDTATSVDLEARVGHDVRHRRQDQPADDLVRLHRLRPRRPAGRGGHESAGVLARRSEHRAGRLRRRRHAGSRARRARSARSRHQPGRALRRRRSDSFQSFGSTVREWHRAGRLRRRRHRRSAFEAEPRRPATSSSSPIAAAATGSRPPASATIRRSRSRIPAFG